MLSLMLQCSIKHYSVYFSTWISVLWSYGAYDLVYDGYGAYDIASDLILNCVCDLVTFLIKTTFKFTSVCVILGTYSEYQPWIPL